MLAASLVASSTEAKGISKAVVMARYTHVVGSPSIDARAPVDLAVAGDDRAFSKLILPLVPGLRRAIQRELPRRHTAVLSVEDVLQQTLIDAFQAFPSLSKEKLPALSGWLAQIARRNVIDATRMLDADKRGGGSQATSRCSRADQVVDPRPSRSPGRAAGRQESLAALQAVLDRLPRNYARIIRGYDLEGRSMESVAADIGRSRGAGFMIRARAIRLLREFLGSTSRFFSSTA